MKRLAEAALVLGLAAIISWAQGSPDFTLDKVSQSVRVTAMVNKKARIEVIEAAQEIAVTPSDSSRDYLDVRDAVRLMVWCNSLDGVQVTARLPEGIRDPSGMSRPRGLLALGISPGGGFHAFNGSPLVIYESSGKDKATPISCSLRLCLPPGSATGLYRLGLSFEAIPK